MGVIRSLFAPHALLPDGWARDVLLHWDARGHFTAITPQSSPPPGVTRAAGPVLPGMPNLHSHAFQFGMAGQTEYQDQADDSFWTWRTLMYRLANALTPESLEAIATALYVEMLEAGYTSVCEFHYIHHDPSGRAYADSAAMSLALLRAAERAGIGLTLLPVFYQTGGFGALPPADGQRRFLLKADDMLSLLAHLQPLCQAQGVRLGFAPHSLRAVSPDSLREVLTGFEALDPTAPIHIHVAEQTAEVDACLAWSGQRPVQWLLNNAPIDERWCLVHATHMDADEYRRAAASGAVAGLCPTTEANLGDGVFDATRWCAAGGQWGIGSDSHTCVNAAEELMLLEYGQRLATGRRNVLASSEHRYVATAMMLQAVAGGAQASGRPIAGLAVGQQADWVALDAAHPSLAALPCPNAMLAAHVFASHRQSAIHQVCVAGTLRVSAGRHALGPEARAAFTFARAQLG